MALITSIQELEDFVRISFNNNQSSLPDFEVAELVYLVPLLGNTLYGQVSAFAYNPGAEPEPMTEEYQLKKDLLRACRRVIAPLGYLLDLPTHQVQLSDAGLRTSTTDNYTPAHRWEYNEVKDHLADRGALAIELLLQLLFRKKDALAAWTESEQYKELSELAFTSAADFNRYYRVQHPYRVFWELRPIMREVQDFYIYPAIGEAFFKELLTKADPVDEEKAALVLLRKTIAQYTILRAAERLSVRVTAAGFTIQLGAGAADAANAGDAAATTDSLQLLAQSCLRTGDTYLLQLRDLLNSKASAELFATYKNSSLYVSPSAAGRPNVNDNLRSIFSL